MVFSTIQLYKNAYDGLSKRIWLLSVVMLINRSGTMVLAFLTLYCTHLGYSIKQAGLVVALYGIGSVAGGFLGGKISDRFGFYQTQFLALFSGGILFIVLGQMRSFDWICIITFILSMVNESFRPANATAIAHYSTAENRTQSFSLIRLAINLGWGVGSALGGLLASIDYHLLFLVDGCTNIAASLLLLRVLPKVTLNEQRAAFHAAEKIKTVSPYRDKAFMYFSLLIILFAFCFFQLFTTVPIFFKSDLHLDEFWIGAVMAANGLMIALFEMVLVYKMEGTKPYLTLMFIGTICMAVSFLLLHLPLFNGLIVACIFIFVITVSEMIAMPFMNSYYISRSNDLNRGQYAGLYTMSWSIGQIAGSSLGALLAEGAGFYNLWWIVMIVCLLTGIGFKILQKTSS